MMGHVRMIQATVASDGPSFYASGLPFSLSERRDGGQIGIFLSISKTYGPLTAFINHSLIPLLVCFLSLICVFSFVVRSQCL